MNSDQFRSFLKAVLPAMGYQWRRFERRNMRRRIRSRMEQLKIQEAEKYAQLVELEPSERLILDSMLRLTITRFFRNSRLWQELALLIRKDLEKHSADDPLLIWSAGCAGGEESFSIAMLLADPAEPWSADRPWRILATDTDGASLARTRYAKYQWGSVREVPPHLLTQWFTEKDGLWTLSPEIRDIVAFKEHDLVSGAPPGRFHIVFLRNSILTYNTEEIQCKVLKRIHGCLLDPAYLVIGRTEKMPAGAGFEEISKCIYTKV